MEDSSMGSEYELFSLVGNASTSGNPENKIIEEVQDVTITESKDSSPIKNIEDSLVALQHKDNLRDRDSTCITSSFEGHYSGGNLEPLDHANIGEFLLLFKNQYIIIQWNC